MNRRRRWILFVGVSFFLLTVLVPPWGLLDDDGVYFHGWRFLFDARLSDDGFVMEYRTLLVEWAALAAVMAALWFAFEPDKKPSPPT